MKANDSAARGGVHDGGGIELRRREADWRA